MRIVVMGAGNPDRGDDGLGPAVAERLRLRVPEGVEILESGADPLRLVDASADADGAIVVDALVPGRSPGRLRRFDAAAGPLPCALFATSTHGVGVAHAIELARALRMLPPHVVVFGVEGAGFAPRGAVSPGVARAVDAAVEAVLAEIAVISRNECPKLPSA